MSYEPHFTISPALVSSIEEIARLRQRISDASIELAWIPALQKDNCTRSAHASTAIEGNPLPLEVVRAIADGAAPPVPTPRSEREVVNCLAGLRFVEELSAEKRITKRDVLDLHRVLLDGVLDQGKPGAYRDDYVSAGGHLSPNPAEVPKLMSDLLKWWNGPSATLSPVITSAIIHYRVEAIHPFADGNGRVGRALVRWELYRRGFDRHHIFAVDEYFSEDRPAYYAALDQVRVAEEDLSAWLEYCARGLEITLERTLGRIQAVAPDGTERVVLRPRQERLLQLLRVNGSMAPAEIWDALGVSRQGAMDLINPLLGAGLIEKLGTKKTGRYSVKKP